jgi:hypothetical protein
MLAVVREMTAFISAIVSNGPDAVDRDTAVKACFPRTTGHCRGAVVMTTFATHADFGHVARICPTLDGSSTRRYRGSVSSNVANRRSARLLRSNAGRSAVDSVAPSRATSTLTPKLRKGATIHATVVVGSV